MALKLYSYWRSSAAWRVRIALNLKGLAYETVPVHLLNDGGEQYRPDYRQLSPDAMVPSLVEDDWSLSQSLNISKRAGQHQHCCQAMPVRLQPSAVSAPRLPATFIH
jgi:glutathione S-transferase